MIHIKQCFNRIKLGIMKTSKAKAISKPKKISEVGETVNSKKVTTSKSVPGEEEIRKRADQIYHKRIARGEHGTALDELKSNILFHNNFVLNKIRLLILF